MEESFKDGTPVHLLEAPDKANETIMTAGKNGFSISRHKFKVHQSEPGVFGVGI